MFRFANEDILYLLYFSPLLILLFWWTYRFQKKALKSFASEKMHRIILPFRSRFRIILKSVLLFLSIILLVFAFANPQIGSKIEEVKQVGIDVYILLDVSLSMTAEDIKPNRLAKAKFEISKLIQRLRGDRIGLIIFSGEAYVQFPLTTDYSAANLFLSAVDVNSIPQPGTAIAPALNLALNSFKKEEETKKAIVIITDGEDHEGDFDSIIGEAVEKDVALYAIGLGSPTGVPIPIYNKSGNRTGYKKDRRGQVVLTKLDEEVLREITAKGNGNYYRGTNTEDELEQIYNDLSKLEDTEFGATKITEYEDRFYYFLTPAILLLFIEFFITNKRSKLFARMERLENE
ncbi:MAG: VWA domain-containing protein [Melioribacteraceae bacterium]|nr:VWA domain-containing protein [Melioribacteraceae bacterium]MCF8263855.1 VWA domain-containing protein [Melioribacteraceae bacterium]MCF8414518.1 VWA domain-containing protein [Melioribacteraceae bacterium]